LSHATHLVARPLLGQPALLTLACERARNVRLGFRRRDWRLYARDFEKSVSFLAAIEGFACAPDGEPDDARRARGLFRVIAAQTSAGIIYNGA